MIHSTVIYLTLHPLDLAVLSSLEKKRKEKKKIATKGISVNDI